MGRIDALAARTSSEATIISYMTGRKGFKVWVNEDATKRRQYLAESRNLG
jgi:hypothetical protein